MHRKLVFVKVESSIIEISESVHRSEMKFYWDPKEQSTKRHPVNIRFPKKLVQHIGEVPSC